MNARHALLLLALPLALAGCGNKGPLVMPEPPVAEDPAVPAGSVPVDVQVPATMPVDEPAGALPDPTSVDPLLGDPALTDPMPATEDPAPDEAGLPATDPGSEPGDPAAESALDPLPIDPDTVPAGEPEDGSTADGDG